MGFRAAFYLLILAVVAVTTAGLGFVGQGSRQSSLGRAAAAAPVAEDNTTDNTTDNTADNGNDNSGENTSVVVVEVTPIPAPTATPAPQQAAPPPAAPPPPPVVVPQPVPVAQPCVFTLGFQDLHNRVLAAYGDVVGACLENEHGNPDNRDTLQRTAGGLMVWQATTNTMRFTNGSQTWVYSACGLQTRLNTQTFVWETSPAIAAQTTPAPGTCDLV
jgi:hypothetical protein